MNLPATFRGALDVVPASSGMEKLQQLEQAMREEIEEIPIDDLTSHQWCDGVYCRRFFLPKGALVVSKVHRKQNWFLLFDGIVNVVVAVSTRTINDLWWLGLVLGIAEILIGFWAVGYIGRSIALLVVWVAAAALARGISSLVTGFTLHGADKKLREVLTPAHS